ncbi:MAG: hypothetical protein Q8L14_12180 [Myxococcales bacterium]|nr:hypothetical protein [Myxococcales bacterium]
MTIEGIKPKAVGTPKVASTQTAAPTTAIDAPPPPPPEEGARAEGYEPPKKKLMSVSGRFKATANPFALRPDLQNLVAAQRSATHAAGGSHGARKPLTPVVHERPDNAGNLGSPPPARAAEADFLALAKKANPKATPEALEKAAATLAKAAIEKKFGLSVKNGDAKWTAEELTRVYEGFSMMPQKDQAVLKGMDLVREHQSSEADALAEYRPNVDGERRSIAVFDGFITGDARRSRQHSIHSVIHEAGHALEQRPMHDAQAAVNKALAALEPAERKATRAKENENRVWGNKDDSGTVNWAIAEYGTAKDKKGIDFLNAQQGVTDALHQLSTATTPKQEETAEKALTTAKTKRDKLDMSEHPKSFRAKDWVEATDTLETAIRARREVDGEVAPLKKAADASQKTLDSLATTEQTPDGDVLKSKTRAGYESARKKDKAGQRDVSAYGATSTVENFAEAYALYVRDPGLLKTKSPEQFKYFEKHHPQP